MLVSAALLAIVVAEWSAVGGDAGGARYSELSQIHRGNVGRLKPAWTYETGAKPGDAPMQATPILAEGRLIFVSGHHRVIALDPVAGTRIWVTPLNNVAARSGHTRSSRGVAYWSDGRPGGERRVLCGTPDGWLLSLDARTGKPDVRFGSVDLRAELGPQWSNAYVGVSAAPLVIRDTVLVGLAADEGAGAAPADILAFDVRMGRRRWRFHVNSTPRRVWRRHLDGRRPTGFGRGGAVERIRRRPQAGRGVRSCRFGRPRFRRRGPAREEPVRELRSGS